MAKKSITRTATKAATTKTEQTIHTLVTRKDGQMFHSGDDKATYKQKKKINGGLKNVKNK